MTTIATRLNEKAVFPARPGLGLSGRLILLTILFVMVAEILIYVPALAGFRAKWISDRLMGAQMIALALSSAPQGALTGELEGRLLAGVKGAQAIGVRGPGTRWLLADLGRGSPEVTHEIDLRKPRWTGAIGGALRTLFVPNVGPTRIIGEGAPGIAGVEWVELVVDERPLRDAMLDFTGQFFAISLVISGITSALLYWALHILVVRPVRRLTDNVSHFAVDPEDGGRVLRETGRQDELGIAERALARMQRSLADALRQKRHLAELGLAVSKINHELRNMLTTAQLLSDRLGEVEEPSVKRIAPRLVATLDRAIAFCSSTLAYGRASEPPPRPRRIPLAPLVAEQLDLTKLGDGHPIEVVAEIPDSLELTVDPDQLGRLLLNLMRNAVEALSQARTPGARITVRASRDHSAVRIAVGDNGPGVPDRIRAHLFSAFRASERSGGTGLGLPVADELARLNGGTLELVPSETGACFTVTIPDAA